MLNIHTLVLKAYHDHLVLHNLILLQGLPDLGEIYPLGGSADRLGLVDSNTGECLPAAMLPYCGWTLLEGLIRDLQVLKLLMMLVLDKGSM